jgi:hypothetical protein
MGAGLADWWCHRRTGVEHTAQPSPRAWLLERAPLLAAVLLAVLRWDQAAAVVGRGGRTDWRIKSKRRPHPNAARVER